MRDWAAYCDVCGQRIRASSATKLSQYTGRGGLIVCRHDVDAIDPGLVPFLPRKEQNIPWARPGHIDTTDGSPMVDLETMSITFYLAASQDNTILTPSQDENDWLIVSEPV